MTEIDIPLLDIGAFRAGTAEERRAFARRMDAALQSSGFLLIAGHGMDAELMGRVRAGASRFFGLPVEQKAEIATRVAGRGWLPVGGEANSFYGEDSDPARADMKESLTQGRNFSTGDDEVDAEWFAENAWPAQVPELPALADELARQAREVYYDLLRASALALGLEEEWFVDRAQASPHTFNINRYPPLTEVGAALEGQYRVGPHTDWGTYTLLDRQPGYGGLQVQTLDGDWVDAPYEAGALTINVGDLLARWVGDRWRSTRHRVQAPQTDAPTEELISLIFFMEVDMDLEISPLVPGTDYPPVVCADYFRQRAAAATVS
ncbi:2-oxoglutarate and iron-dependent oxygenase domain-containing protein [Nocardioides sp. YIM 152588]|uniref:isopenicillin N synthase family dioxygenase n=1 Tax=Nocardioides sp. YIM 152588 TaxID=3158259 RepID=UPI0032E3C9BF